jgi:hypothetical protein
VVNARVDSLLVLPGIRAFRPIGPRVHMMHEESHAHEIATRITGFVEAPPGVEES